MLAGRRGRSNGPTWESGLRRWPMRDRHQWRRVVLHSVQGQRGAGPLLQGGLHWGLRAGEAQRLLALEEVTITLQATNLPVLGFCVSAAGHGQEGQSTLSPFSGRSVVLWSVMNQTSSPPPQRRGAGALLLTLALVALGAANELFRQEWLGRALWATTGAWALCAASPLLLKSKPASLLASGVALAGVGFVPWMGLIATAAWVLLLLTIAPVCLVVLVTKGRFRAAVRAFSALALALALLGLTMAGTALRCGSIDRVDESQPWKALQALAASDQQDRKSGCFVLNPQRDAKRREVALRLLSRNGVPPPEAAADAGLLFLHGSSVEDLSLAHELLGLAARSGHGPAAVLERAALDRLRLARGQPQVHGTQWIHRP